MDGAEQGPRREDDVVVARLRRPWGRRGELILELYTDWPAERLAPGRPVRIAWDDGREIERTVAGYRVLQQGSLLALEGVGDISAAQNLAGGWIVARRGELPELGEDEWHHADLVGLGVVLRDGTAVGRVEGVDESVQADLLRVSVKGREVLVPFVPAICVAVDLVAGTLTIDPPGGLLDLGEAETA